MCLLSHGFLGLAVRQYVQGCLVPRSVYEIFQQQSFSYCFIFPLKIIEDVCVRACVLSAAMTWCSPVRRKLHGSSDRKAAFLSSPPRSPWDRSDGCHSTALTASVGTHKHTHMVTLTSIHYTHTHTHTHTHTQAIRCGKSPSGHLKIPPLFKDGDHRFVDVSDELVSLWLPQIVHTQLELLHQGVLHSTERSTGMLKRKWKNNIIIIIIIIIVIIIIIIIIIKLSNAIFSFILGWTVPLRFCCAKC